MKLTKRVTELVEALGYDPYDSVTLNFRVYEVVCRCCGGGIEEVKRSGLLDSLEELRRIIGNRPIIVNSMFRCRIHNADVGGSPNSQHLFGMAADIVIPASMGVPALHPDAIAIHASTIEAFRRGGIGKYGSMVHLDIRPNGPARWTGGGYRRVNGEDEE